MRFMVLAALVAGLAGCAASHQTTTTTTSTGTGATASARVTADSNMPPGEENAKAVLDASPRHGEFVDVAIPGETTKLRTWVVYPERKDKAGVVLLIHEIYGLSDWMRGVADRLAGDGYIAVAPDLVSGMGPGGGGTDSAASRDDVVKLVRALTPEVALARLDAARNYATALPAANGKVATMGFCWGGGMSFRYAAQPNPPSAAIVFYGSSPDSLTLPRVQAPVLGLYGGDDARVNATIEPAKAALAGKVYEVHIYEGAGHGFLRGQTQREGANLKAATEAWPTVLAFLKTRL